jgi:hypothetical protein
MLANRLYSALWKQMIRLRPKERITRLRNMIWLMVGIYLSCSVHLSKVALKIPGRAKVPRWIVKSGQRRQVDRAERRDLSIFQIGLRWVERCLTNAWPVSTKFMPSFG